MTNYHDDDVNRPVRISEGFIWVRGYHRHQRGGDLVYVPGHLRPVPNAPVVEEEEQA